jgi:hypothetical protein
MQKFTVRYERTAGGDDTEAPSEVFDTVDQVISAYARHRMGPRWETHRMVVLPPDGMSAFDLDRLGTAGLVLTKVSREL